MTTKKDASVKLYRLVLSMILILVLAIASIAAIRYKRGGDSKQQSEKTLNQLLSCTLRQAEDFEAAAVSSRASIEAAEGEIGLAQGDGRLKDYLKKQFGDFMTNECIEDLAMSRTFYRSIALTKDFNSDIEAGEIMLTKRSGEEECYTFSAEIKTAAGTPAADTRGTISMKKDGDNWKASRITLNMSEARN